MSHAEYWWWTRAALVFIICLAGILFAIGSALRRRG